jgi:hypothetical protein
LGNEGFTISNVLYTLFKGGCVVSNSLSGIINSLLAQAHEIAISCKLIFFLLSGKVNAFNKFSSDIVEFSDEFLKHFAVGEICELDEGFDHGCEFSFFEFLTELLEGFLDFGDLDKRGSS